MSEVIAYGETHSLRGIRTRDCSVIRVLQSHCGRVKTKAWPQTFLCNVRGFHGDEI